jgi:hypothetical protein
MYANNNTKCKQKAKPYLIQLLRAKIKEFDENFLKKLYHRYAKLNKIASMVFG